MLGTGWVRPIRDSERAQLGERLVAAWGSATVVSRGRAHHVPDLDCLIALRRGEWLGVAAYRVEGSSCELVLLEAYEPFQGTGTMLLAAVLDRARAAEVDRVWLITTNDNVDALRFYQRRGFALVGVHRDAVTEARRLLKPEIPLVGRYGIELRDEVELEYRLAESRAGA